MSHSKKSLCLLVAAMFSLAGCQPESNQTASSQKQLKSAAATHESRGSEDIQDPDLANTSNSTKPSRGQSDISNDQEKEVVDPGSQPPVAKDLPQEPEVESGENTTVDRSAPVQSDFAAPEEQPGQEKQTIPIPDSWVRLGKQHEIWIDMKAKQVIVAGHICMRQGPLEVFACPRRTKEHESIVSVNALASQVHSCLIALGADPGSPVEWSPEYKPARGPVIAVEVMWNEGDQTVRRRAQEMVRNFETKQPLDLDWVFGGSQIYQDPETGTNYYYGDAGELICLSNFSTATLDLPIQSSDANSMLLFEANPDKIPEPGTKVYVVLSPKKQDDLAPPTKGQ